MKLKNDFENYLQDIFTRDNPQILDDDLSDRFNDHEWDIDNLIKYGNEFGAKLAEQIINDVKDYQDTIPGGVYEKEKKALLAKYLKE
jgi:hypothetical protein